MGNVRYKTTDLALEDLGGGGRKPERYQGAGHWPRDTWEGPRVSFCLLYWELGGTQRQRKGFKDPDIRHGDSGDSSQPQERD